MYLNLLMLFSRKKRSRMRYLEYFHDHVRIEEMFFEGTLSPNRVI